MREEDGRAAVFMARRAIEAETSGMDADIRIPETFTEPSGVFVTLKTFPEGDLRGCIGYPEAVFPLYEALMASARSACHDPRFPDLKESELDNITVEVTILSVPERIISEPITDNIEIGRDGLIMESGGRRGLLLPQVPVEWGWGSLEYLENLSRKAGLPKDAWRRSDAVIYRFTGEIFSEEEPNGEVKGHV